LKATPSHSISCSPSNSFACYRMMQDPAVLQTAPCIHCLGRSLFFLRGWQGLRSALLNAVESPSFCMRMRRHWTRTKRHKKFRARQAFCCTPLTRTSSYVMRRHVREQRDQSRYLAISQIFIKRSIYSPMHRQLHISLLPLVAPRPTLPLPPTSLSLRVPPTYIVIVTLSLPTNCHHPQGGAWFN